MRQWNRSAAYNRKRLMKRLLTFLALACISVAPVQTSAGVDLLQRMGAINPSLRSYTATMHAHVVLTSLLGFSADLVGTYYHKDPNLDKLVITQGLPGIAKQFSELYPHIESPARWSQIFDVTMMGDDGTTATFKLVPRKRGNIDHIDAMVDDKTATVKSMTWHYYNGGSAIMNNNYSTIDGNVLITSQTGKVDEPSYKGDISSTLSDYKINPPIDDKVFAQQ